MPPLPATWPAWPALLTALGTLALHLAVSARYGIFRDELYYLACAKRLAWGYVDHPPLSIAVLAAVRAVIGDGLFAIRLVPALAGSAVIVLAAAMARRMGGGTGAQVLAALCVALAPTYLVVNGFYSMNSLDTLIWSVALFLFMDVVEDAPAVSTRRWLVLGVVLGLGLLNKLSVLWLGAGIAVALLATPARAALRTRGPWLAAAAAALLLAPHVVWQVANDWPTAEFMRNAAAQKMARVSPLDYMAEQVLAMNPAAALVWTSGLAWLLAGDGRKWRGLSLVYLTVLAIVLLPGTSRSQYLTPAYPPLLAAGAVAIEAYGRRRDWRWPLPAAFVAVALVGAAILPLVRPILPVERLIRYQQALGLAPRAEERKQMGPLPQYLADMFGWPEMAAAVSAAAASLSAEERASAIVYAQNYGEAGALERFGVGLPRVVSGHNNYWLWGPGPRPVTAAIILGGDLEDHLQSFERVERVGTTPPCPYCMPYEQDLGIFVSRGLRRPVAELWRDVQHYD